MKSRLILYCFFLFLNTIALAQDDTEDFCFLFYNTENLFDTADDPETADEEFTPMGARRWTKNRLNKKLLNISKVIFAASGWTPAHLIALCEVENTYVLNRLLNETPLQSLPYSIIHKDSPDSRGIDVAFIYNTESFYPLKYQYIPLVNKKGVLLESREILYVSGILSGTDTLHIFINHWPSRYSGLLESEPARECAALTLRHFIDSVQNKHLHPKIVVAGDFNDQPNDRSLSVYLKAGEPVKDPEKDTIYNLSYSWMKQEIQTLKHQSQWSVFDQILVSGSMINNEDKLCTNPEWADIAKLPFLLETDDRYGGKKLNRTYNGFRYHGGFSDHLPVTLKIRKVF